MLGAGFEQRMVILIHRATAAREDAEGPAGEQGISRAVPMLRPFGLAEASDRRLGSHTAADGELR